MNNELLSTILEAVATQKDKIDDIQSVLDLLQDETKSNQEEIIKVRDTLTKQIEDIIIQTQKLIDKAISTISIEVPKVDYDKIKNIISKDFTKLEDYIKSIMPKDGKDGLDGKDADNELIIKELKQFIIDNKSDFKGKDGKDGLNGKNGINGKDGKDGSDGVGIDDIKRDKDDLVITLTNGTIKRFALPKQTIKYMGGGSSNSDTSTPTGAYTNLTPVPNTLGGILSGTIFDNVELTKVLDMLLYPYQTPSFTSFAISGLSNLNYEVGYTFVGGDKTFTWTTSNSENVKTDSITLNGVSGLSNDGSEVQTLEDITKTTVSTHTFTISALNTNNQSFSRTLTLSWGLKRFWGVSPDQSVEDSEILTWSNEISTSRTKTATYDCSGGRHFYIAYPTAWGDMNNTKINNLSWNDWVLVKRDFINVYGVSIPFNIYRSFNLLNGTITVNWA